MYVEPADFGSRPTWPPGATTRSCLAGEWHHGLAAALPLIAIVAAVVATNATLQVMR